MNTIELGTRLTGNRLTKITSIRKEIIEGEQEYSFYSSYDGCGYRYPRYSLYDAIKAYENDTRWQGFAEIRYYTIDAEIKEEFDKMPPF